MTNLGGDPTSCSYALTCWLDGAAINRDRSLRLQYLAGLSLNTNAADTIYNSILKFARFPEDVFTGSPENVAALRNSLQRRHY